MKQVSYYIFETSLGSCGIAWSEEGNSQTLPTVAFFQLPEASAKLTESRIAGSSGGRLSSVPPPSIAAVIKKVCRHLRGEAQDFRDTPLDLDGAGPFARQVYEAARNIPLGQTRTYGELAKALDRPNAARAVGQALGQNPIALIIPCHRVLAAGSRPGGFSAHGGLTTKARMLALEGVLLEPPPTIQSVRDLRRAAGQLRSRDPRLAHCLAQPIEFRLKPEQSPYRTLLEAVVHQQLTGKAAATILGRVKALFPGSPFPEPEDLLKTPDQALREAGLSSAKTASLKDLAAKTLDGTVPSKEKIVTLGDEEIIRGLTSIRGVGRWTVEMLLIFNLGRKDVFPVDDYAIRRSVALVLGMKEAPTPKQLIAVGEAWRPLRTVVSLYLWNYLKPKEAETKVTKGLL